MSTDTNRNAAQATEEAAPEVQAAPVDESRKRAHDAFVARGIERLKAHLTQDASIHSVAEAIFRHLLEDRPYDVQVEEQVDGEGNKVVPPAGAGAN